MEKTALIFIGIVLFSTCTPIQARTGYLPCKKKANCVSLKCPTPFGSAECVKGGCECPLQRIVAAALPIDHGTNCVGVDSCIQFCKAKGKQADACLNNRCYCIKPPM
ncbi:hypothetical protein CARUB_v10006993mg [Capsella rubella]|uniref:Knottin scorpion toxin-like domain-containing protein n=1 Tax=Capsella rubella TaxID=81985 RepID=R0H1F6_9BRAS|nr:putative defensin-like protein 307 [Capsella rubella]EOA18450.1 hypothetical protein CARUB_v10006993mg [Capsella rubella]